MIDFIGSSLFILLSFGIVLIVLVFLVIIFVFGWRSLLFMMTGHTLIPFFPFIVNDDTISCNTWLGFRDLRGNNRLHIAVLSGDYKKIHWFSLSKYLRDARNDAGLLPSDLIELIQDKQLRGRVLRLFEERASTWQTVANRGEKANS
jgi:hypothetical protein